MLALVVGLGLGWSLTAQAQAAVTETFTTGASTFVVPPGVTALEVHAVGGQGGRGYLNRPVGGRAAVLDGTLEATPGDSLFLFTAGNGGQCIINGTGAGYNGGGRASDPCAFGGGGGGASDIRTVAGDLSTRVVVAAGGGGAGDYGDGGNAGAAAGPDTEYGCLPTAQPGTAVAGGAVGGACGANPTLGTDGSFGLGGNSSYRSDTRGNVEGTGGGGGGGWYGGGGGSTWGGGGGGASHASTTVSGVEVSLAPLGSTPVISLTYTGPTLTVATAGTGSGYVDAPPVASSTPLALDCGHNPPGTRTACAKEYRPGATVTLTAHADTATSTFTGFSGGGCSGTGPCTVTMDAAKTVTATFALTERALTVTAGGTGAGYVDSLPAGIDCGGGGHADCTATYPHGTEVTLTAHPDAASSTFTGFSGGGCSGTGPCTVTMDQARDVTATFTLVERSLTVGATGTGTGFVDSVPAGIDCGASGHVDCVAAYAHGTAVTLTAHADTATSSFTGFSGGGCSGTGPCTVTMDAAKTVTATFGPAVRALTVITAGTGTGYVESVPAGIDCGYSGHADCVAGYAHGTEVTLTAHADTATSSFTGFSGGGCSGAGPCTVTMDQARDVTATFALIPPAPPSPPPPPSPPTPPDPPVPPNPPVSPVALTKLSVTRCLTGARPRGTVAYTVSAASTVTFTLQRRVRPSTGLRTTCPKALPAGVPGDYVTVRRPATRATGVRPTTGRHVATRAAPATKPLTASVTVSAGAHTFSLRTLLGGTTLRPGRYRVLVQAISSTGATAQNAAYLWVLQPASRGRG